MSECTEKLKINPALRLLVLPLSTAEYTALETDILTNGSQKPVQCWHSYIISDFERVEICRRHKISFDVYKTNFLSEIEIVAQICERELSERILPSDMRRYLIGNCTMQKKSLPHTAPPEPINAKSAVTVNFPEQRTNPKRGWYISKNVLDANII